MHGNDEIQRVASMLHPKTAARFFRTLTELETDLLEDIYHAIEARLNGDEYLVLLTTREFHLVHSSDSSLDLHLWRGAEIFSTGIQIADPSIRGATIQMSGLLDFSLEVPHSEAVDLHRELQGEPFVALNPRSGIALPLNKNSTSQSLQNWSLGVGIAASLLPGFGIVPLIGIGLGVVAISRSLREDAGLGKAVAGTVLSVLALLVHLAIRDGSF